MPTILAAGGLGFIGSHTCLALLEKGFQVHIIDSFENSSNKVVERILQIYNNKKRIVLS